MDDIVNPFDGEVTDSQIKQWLAQFEPTERSYLVHLLPHFRYYSSRRFEMLLRAMTAKIEAIVGRNWADLGYVPIGQVSDKGSPALCLYRQMFSITNSQILSLDSLPNDGEKPLVVVDDFIDSGRTASRVWNEHIKLHQSTKPVILAAVIGTRDGVKYLRHKTDFSIVTGEILDPPQPLHPNAGLLNEEERKALLTIMQKYTKLLCPGVYSRNIDLRSLIGFFYNTPESTFPVFWSTVTEWVPLLPCRNKETSIGSFKMVRRRSSNRDISNRSSEGGTVMSKHSRRFRVALSFPGEYRDFVERVANSLAASVQKECVLYDKYHEVEFARPNLDTYLQRLYHDESELIVVFLCNSYEEKEWCGLEFRAIRDLIKKKKDASIMFFRFDDADVSGIFGIDGYISIDRRIASDIARLILERLAQNSP